MKNRLHGIEGLDQAAGLRRLLHASPPEVLAVLPCSSGSTRWLADQLRERAAAGQRVLALEERRATGNLADCLGVSPRFDLYQSVSGELPESAVLCEAVPGLELAMVAGLAEAIGSERVFNQRCIASLQKLRAGRDEWALVAQPGELTGLSQLTLAAPRVLLVMDTQHMAVTKAYASLKQLARHGGERQIAVCMARPCGQREESAFANFCEIALQRLDIPLIQVNSVEEALQLGTNETGVSADAFIERLVQTASGATHLRGRVGVRN